MKNPITAKEKRTGKLFIVFPIEGYLFDIKEKRILICADDIDEAEYNTDEDTAFVFDIDRGKMSDCCNVTLVDGSEICHECGKECNPVDLIEEVTFYQISNDITFNEVKDLATWIAIIEREHELPASVTQLNDLFTRFGGIFSPKSNKKSNDV